MERSFEAATAPLSFVSFEFITYRNTLEVSHRSIRKRKSLSHHLDTKLSRFPFKSKRIESYLQVNICATAFASIDSKHFFSTVGEELLKRIIWIPESWYKGAGWYCVVRDTKRQNITLTTHDQFYSEKRGQQLLN